MADLPKLSPWKWQNWDLNPGFYLFIFLIQVLCFTLSLAESDVTPIVGLFNFYFYDF